MTDLELRYEASNDDLDLMARVYINSNTDEPYAVQYITSDDDGDWSQWRFFKHYDDAEAHADAFCFGG